MTSDDAYRCFARFGLGPRPGDLGALGGDPQGALVAEIADPAGLRLDAPDLPDSATAYGEVRAYQMARRAAKASAAVAEPPAGAPQGADAAGMTGPGGPAKPARTPDRPDVPGPQDLMLAEITARLQRVQSVPIGFGERLVAFWSNHFAVQAASNGIVRGLAGSFEREAIRPHVLGRFHDLLLAATQHPAMLVSLNNFTSIGPDSPQGRRSGKGLNENHARELMELHSIGVDGGYSQADVTSFAKILTGWSFGTAERQPDQFGRFVFRPQAHEPGPQTVMGKAYAQKGVAQGEAVIADLAASPATARHIALKLARAFVSDTPDAGLVRTLSDTFLRTGGDLKAVTLALVKAPEAWAAEADKMRSPQEFLWAALRALALTPKPNFVVRTLADLGQPLWDPPSPQGFKDDTATWLAPDAMTTRVDTAELMAAQARDAGDPRDLAEAVLGEALSPDTRTAIARAESRQQGLALMLMSPEFQRR